MLTIKYNLNVVIVPDIMVLITTDELFVSVRDNVIWI